MIIVKLLMMVLFFYTAYQGYITAVHKLIPAWVKLNSWEYTSIFYEDAPDGDKLTPEEKVDYHRLLSKDFVEHLFYSIMYWGIASMALLIN